MGKCVSCCGDCVVWSIVGTTVALAFVTPKLLEMRPIGPNAVTKPFNDFESFYPFYMTQHQDETCRRLHVVVTTLIIIMALFDPYILPSCATAALAASSVFQLTKDLEHGFLEGIVMFGVFLVLMRRFTGNWWKGLSIPLLSYGFAWVGHFYFEHNKPASFIYPMYSLGGDLRLWFETFSMKRAF